MKLNWTGLSSNPKRWEDLFGAPGRRQTEGLRGACSLACPESQPPSQMSLLHPECSLPLHIGSCLACAPPAPRTEAEPPASPSCSHMVNLTPLVLNPGGFHFSYLTGNNVHELRFPW